MALQPYLNDHSTKTTSVTCAIAQLVTTEAQVRAQISVCGIYVDRLVLGQVFLKSPSVFPCQ